MPYTEIKKRKGKKYFYRVRSIRNKCRFSKERVYLGRDLSKEELIKQQRLADKQLLKDIIESSIKKIKPKIIKILRRYNIKKAGIFGSYARGEQTINSDIDLLIKTPKGIGLKFVQIGLDLEEKLGKKVHLLTYDYIYPPIKEGILNDEVRII